MTTYIQRSQITSAEGQEVDNICLVKQPQLGVASRQVRYISSGEHIGKVTPVPIPNTEVKLSEPMIVPKVRK